MFAYIYGCLPPNMFNVFQYLAPPLKHSYSLGHHFFQLQLWTLATWWIPSWIYAERTLPPWRWVFGVKVLRVSDRSVVRFEPYCEFNTFILHIFKMLFQAKGLGGPRFLLTHWIFMQDMELVYTFAPGRQGAISCYQGRKGWTGGVALKESLPG